MVKSKPISRAIPYPEKQTVNRTFFMEKKLGVFIRAELFISIKTVNLLWSVHGPKMYPGACLKCTSRDSLR